MIRLPGTIFTGLSLRYYSAIWSSSSSPPFDSNVRAKTLPHPTRIVRKSNGFLLKISLLSRIILRYLIFKLNYADFSSHFLCFCWWAWRGLLRSSAVPSKAPNSTRSRPTCWTSWPECSSLSSSCVKRRSAVYSERSCSCDSASINEKRISPWPKCARRKHSWLDSVRNTDICLIACYKQFIRFDRTASEMLSTLWISVQHETDRPPEIHQRIHESGHIYETIWMKIEENKWMSRIAFLMTENNFNEI